MSITVQTRVSCDLCQTGAPSHLGPSVDRPSARALARRYGWEIGQGRNSRDLCPTCKEAVERNTPAPRRTTTP